MPVTRYRSVEDIPDPPPATSALEGLAAACAASTVSRAFGHTARAPRGVRRFASIADADAHRQGWEAGGTAPDEHLREEIVADQCRSGS